MRMNHNDIIAEVAKQSGYSAKDVCKIISVFIKVIKSSMLQGCTVIIKGFVRFEVGDAASKRTYNFQDKIVKPLPKRKLPKAAFVPDFVAQIKNHP